MLAPLIFLLSSAALTFAAPEAITVTVTETAPCETTPVCPDPTPTCPDPTCVAPCNIYNPWPNGACGDISNRVTCTVFNPLEPSAHFGLSFCMCQAGYRGDGLAPDSPDQYRVTWTNALGDQTHRVFVKPGTTCNTLCNETGANTCSEVPVRDGCR